MAGDQWRLGDVQGSLAACNFPHAFWWLLASFGLVAILKPSRPPWPGLKNAPVARCWTTGASWPVRIRVVASLILVRSWCTREKKEITSWQRRKRAQTPVRCRVSPDQIDHMSICSSSVEKQPLRYKYTVDPAEQPQLLTAYHQTSNRRRARRLARAEAPGPKRKSPGRAMTTLFCSLRAGSWMRSKLQQPADGARPKKKVRAG